MTSVIKEFFAWIGFLIKAFILKWRTKKKLDDIGNFLRDKIGKIRFTGTDAVCSEVGLPATYEIKEQSFETDCLVFYCRVQPDPEGTLKWLDDKHVLVHGKIYNLIRTPSKTTDPQFNIETTLIIRGEVFHPSWQERIKFTVRR